MKLALFSRLVYPFYVGGTDKLASFLSNQLVRLGVDTCVITREHYRNFDPEFKMEFSLKEIQWPAIKPGVLAYIIFSQRVWDWIKNNNFDAVYWMGVVIPGFGIKKDMPFAAACLGLEPYKAIDFKNRLLFWPFNIRNNYYFKYVDAAVSFGGKLNDEAVKYMGYPREKIWVIPHAIDTEYIDRVKRQSGSFERKSEYCFLSVSRLTINKGLDRLIQAFSRIEKDYNAELVIAGTGPEEDSLKKLAKNHNIRFLGEVSEGELHYIYSKASCFISPTLYEAMPTVVLEAMYAGLPVIVSDVGAVQTVVNNETGYLVEPGNIDQLVQTIKDFMSLSSERKTALGNASKKRVIDNFTMPKAAASTKALLENLIGKKRL